MPDSPFFSPSYPLDEREASVSRTVNLMLVPLEPGNERSNWVLRDVPGLVKVTTTAPPVHECLEGPNWNDRSIASRTWYAIAYGENGVDSPIFLAGGYNASTNRPCVSVSNDNGNTWNAPVDLMDLSGYGISDHNLAWGNGIFVASGNAAEYVTSYDGVIWTKRNWPVSMINLKTQITFANGMFVAVSLAAQQIACSGDGINWTVATAPARDWGWATYGSGRWVAAANGGYTAYSVDNGFTWTDGGVAPNPGAANYRDIGYGGGVYVLVSRLNAYQHVLFSTDGGLTWNTSQLTPDPQVTWAGIIYRAGSFILYNSLGNVVGVSQDGDTWTNADSVFSATPTSTSWAVAADPGGYHFAAVGANTSGGTEASVGVC